jgi:hypothetical protein
MFKQFFRKVRDVVKKAAPIAAPLAGAFLGPGWGAGIGALLGQYGGKKGSMQGALMGGLGGLFHTPEGGSSLFSRMMGKSPTAMSVMPSTTEAGSITVPGTSGSGLKGWWGNLGGGGGGEKSGGKMSGILSNLFGKEGSGAGWALGPAIATYLALKADKPEQPDWKSETSLVDDYYAAKARGENPNPADFGLSHTPIDRMIKGLRFDEPSQSYLNYGNPNFAMGGMAQFEDLSRMAPYATGGVVSLYHGGNPHEESDQQFNLNFDGKKLGRIISQMHDYYLDEMENKEKGMFPHAGADVIKESFSDTITDDGGKMSDVVKRQVDIDGNKFDFGFTEEVGESGLAQLRDKYNLTATGNPNRAAGGVVGLALGGNDYFPERQGMIRGPGGPTDDQIPAMLSNGEFVMTADAVKNAGGPQAMYGLMNRLDPDSSRGIRGIA